MTVICDHLVIEKLQGLSAGGCAFVIGIFLHLGIFRFGEWDRSYPKACNAYILAIGLGGLVLGRFKILGEGVTVLEATSVVAIMASLSIFGTFCSIGVYRMFFHPLRFFPGPFWARVSKWYTFILSRKNAQLYEEIEALHYHYGDHVRVGPNEISILDVSAIEKLHGPKTTCTKGPWYDLDPMKNLHNTRSQDDRRQRRRVWDRAFSGKALIFYEPRIAKYTQQLLGQIEKHSGKPMNVSAFFNYYSFDVMGDLAFGSSFNMTEEGVGHYYMTALHAFMSSVGFLTHVIWLAPLVRAIPFLSQETHRFWEWTANQVEKRRLNPPEQPDIFDWILKEYESKEKHTAQDATGLVGDANLIAVAGSDTTAATLSCLFYELAMRPAVQSDIQEEIDSLCRETDLGSADLSKLVHLQGTINETLRLHPAVPSGLQRLTPPDGLHVGKKFIPGNVIVQIPTHTIHRDDRCFERPNEFLPERWGKESGMVKDRLAFTAFSTGPYTCIGKQLALMEIRAVTANVLSMYDVRFAPGFDPGSFPRSKRDSFTLAVGALNLVFDKRSKNN